MHLKLEKLRKGLLDLWSVELDKPEDPAAIPFLSAEAHFYHGVESLVVGLQDLGIRFLVRADEVLSRIVQAGSLRPWMGANPEACVPFNDDQELNHHWAEALQTRFLVRTLLNSADDADLHSVQSRLERLYATTNRLTGEIKGSRNDILRVMLWNGIILDDCKFAMGVASEFVRKNVSPSSRVKSFGKEDAYVRWLLGVGLYVSGDQKYYQCALDSTASLLELHRDFDRPISSMLLAGFSYGYQWAWLWEHVFRAEPSTSHAIDVLRGEVALEPTHVTDDQEV